MNKPDHIGAGKNQAYKFIMENWSQQKILAVLIEEKKLRLEQMSTITNHYIEVLEKALHKKRELEG